MGICGAVGSLRQFRSGVEFDVMYEKGMWQMEWVEEMECDVVYEKKWNVAGRIERWG